MKRYDLSNALTRGVIEDSNRDKYYLVRPFGTLTIRSV